MIGRFEIAERTTDAARRSAATTIVIVGGGPTGVEMSGGFSELIDRVLRRDYPLLDIDASRVVLVEGQDRLLATFAPRLGLLARERLTKMGVDVRLNTQVASVAADRVRLADGTTIMTDTVVWAAGVRAHPLATDAGLETTRGGRVVVDGKLRLPDRPDIHVIGDLAASPLDDDLVPQVASAAIQGGRYVAAEIAAQLDGRVLDDFAYRDKGAMATIGRHATVVELPGRLKLTGFLGWVAWLSLHLVMLIGFRNRLNVLVNWGWNYLTYDRASRLIVEPDP